MIEKTMTLPELPVSEIDKSENLKSSFPETILLFYIFT